jgi:spore germination cell wall hydrolase CwlJ-like protein
MKIIISLIFFLLCAFPVFGHTLDKNDVYWLTQNIYHEARGESLYGQLMVAFVTLDRLNDGRWGDSIKSVVTFPYQFSWYKKGISNVPKNKEEWIRMRDVALLSIFLYEIGIKPNNVLYYHNTVVCPEWSSRVQKVMKVGNHIFYTE